MADTAERDTKLVDLLNEAYAQERQIETTLEAHLEVTTRADYKKRLKDHLKETRAHAKSVERRIGQLGGEAETVHVPGPEGVGRAAQGLQDVVGKAKAAAQGPLHMVRGSGEQAKMLHNARAEFRTEADEIATYTVIESLAGSVGDKQTAKVARDILRQEERMADFLRELLPQLTADMAHDEIPVSQIDGPAARRTATTRKTTTTRKTNSTRASKGTKKGAASSGGRSKSKPKARAKR